MDPTATPIQILGLDAGPLAVEVLGGVLVGLSLGLVGAGGAILSMPIFLLVLGHPTKVAVLEALAVTGSIAAFGATRAAIARKVDARTAAAYFIPGMLGAWIGGPIGKQLDDRVQALLFSVIAIVAAWRMLAAPPAGGTAATQRGVGASLALAIVAGFAIGVLTGVIGVGGGFLLIPALVLLSRVEMHLAVGTSLALIALNAAVAFLSNARQSPADFDLVSWKAVAIVAVCGVVGSVVGGRLASRLPAPVLRRIFAVVLVVVAIAVMVKSTGVLSPARA